jgi:6-phosphogluconolactonase/glucosamine-6-phosphate isomerase/deaminase
MEIKTYLTAEEAQSAAQEELRNHLETSDPLLLLVSGGSAFSLLPDQFEPKNTLTVGVLDERFSQDPTKNNCAQLLALPFATHLSSYIDTRVQAGETLEQLANRFNQALHEWRETHPNGKIVVTQGIGPDGHTSGILPPADLALFEQEWVVGYDASYSKNPHPLRVTTTFSFLRQVDVSILYAVGAEKLPALTHALAPHASLTDYPAAIITQMRHVTLFTDQSLRHG